MEWYWIVLICVGSFAVWLILSAVFYKQFFKRFYDVVLSLLAIIVLSPLLLLLTVVGVIAMKGNPFFTQLRPGMKDKKTGEEKIFKLIKFRTMTNEKDENGNLLSDKERLNKYGKFLRATSLDELPELINILFGNISIVGPRPLLVEYLPWYTEEERHRHDVRPGLTGLAQINGRNDADWNNRLKLDIRYVNAITFFRDITIVLLTVIRVIKRKDIAVDTAHEGNLAKIRQSKLNKI